MTNSIESQPSTVEEVAVQGKEIDGLVHIREYGGRVFLEMDGKILSSTEGVTAESLQTLGKIIHVYNEWVEENADPKLRTVCEKGAA